jgi:hypothetical protein
VEEETGWRPRGIEFVVSCQPVIGNADYPQDSYLAHGAERVGEPEVDETAEVRWVPVDETQATIAKGDILGAITIVRAEVRRTVRSSACHPTADCRATPDNLSSFTKARRPLRGLLAFACRPPSR